jgi:hypothetical protein
MNNTNKKIILGVVAILGGVIEILSAIISDE